MNYHMKVKLLIALAIVLAFLVIVAVGLHIARGNDNQSTEPSEKLSVETVIETEPSAPTEQMPTEHPTEAPTEPEETVAVTDAPTEEPTQAPTQKPSQGSSSSKNDTPKATDPPAPPATEAPSLKFPYAIPGTDLVINQVNSYDGIFLEDGSDQDVTGISVIVLENQGKTGVEYANITLTQNGKQLQYKATAVPAGATIVVQESSAAAYSGDDYTACTADVAQLETFEMSSSLVKVEENEDGSLSVTNLGSETIPCVRIFYKFAMEKGKIYVGGITYTAKITQLEPGTTQQVYPSHYSAGSSEVMMVRTYATAD